MFSSLKVEVIERFSAVESFFKATHGLRGIISKQTARGLSFVQIYAVYEYTVTTVFQLAINTLVSHGFQRKKLKPTLMTLFLDSELKSLKECSPKNIWNSRLRLFEQVFSRGTARIDNTVFPNDGTHFRHTQLHTVFSVLGINRTPAQRKRHLLRIDEVVEHRNAIAHGRETAEEIGRGYTRAEILKRIREMKSVCILLISAIQTHCEDSSRHCR
jgi:hypothetical protein